MAFRFAPAVFAAALLGVARAAQEGAYYEPMGKEMMWLSAAMYCPKEQVGACGIGASPLAAP